MAQYTPAELLERQREHFLTGATLPVERREAALRALRDCLRSHEEEIAAALCADLGKGRFESYMCETGMVLEELSYMLKHLRAYAKPRRARTPLAQFAMMPACSMYPRSSAGTSASGTAVV